MATTPARSTWDCVGICLPLLNRRQSEEAKGAATLVPTPYLIAEPGCTYALPGRKAEARAVLKGLQKRARSTYISPYLFASIYSTLDEKDTAFEWLKKAYAGRVRVASLSFDPQQWILCVPTLALFHCFSE